jgi:hypothetical protein
MAAANRAVLAPGNLQPMKAHRAEIHGKQGAGERLAEASEQFDDFCGGQATDCAGYRTNYGELPLPIRGWFW